MNDDKIIYHYTSLEGLIGIINSQRIWATDILYLNDASEFKYSKAILYKKVKKLRETDPRFKLTKNLDDSLGHYFFEFLEENIEKLFPSEHFSFYVCSFSEEKDLLSQWRGYCQNGIGFSIGFSLDRLKNNFERASFTTTQCIYNKKEQTNLINGLVNKTTDKFISQIRSSIDKKTAWDAKAKYLAVEFVSEFIKLAPAFKHPQFIEEKEWRVISGLQTPKVTRLLRFRPGKTMIIPYVEFSLPKEDGKLMIDEIVIGPTNDNLLSVSSLKLLLMSKNVICRKISSSTIPYRV